MNTILDYVLFGIYVLIGGGTTVVLTVSMIGV